VFRGSPAGLEAAPSWSAESNQAGAQLGSSLASAGDVNGDGHSDLVAGASGYDAGQRNEGRAFVWLGSGSGLAASPAWTAESDQVDAAFGSAVASAGDVNGDGFSDVLAAASLFNGCQSVEGRVSLFFGNGGDGLDRLPRQRRFDDSGPIDLVGLGDEANGFLVRTRARSPYGRDRVRLEVEVKPMDVPFDGTNLLLSPFTDTGAPQAGGSFTDVTVAVPSLAPASHRWRARLRGSFPHPWQSHWMSRAENAATEADLRVPLPVPLTCNAGPAQDAGCVGGTVTLDGSASTGPGPLTYAWSSAAPEVGIASPSSAITDATVSGVGSFVVQLEVSDGVDVETCSTTVSAGGGSAPVEVSAPGAAPLRVTRDAMELRVSFEDRGAPDELVSLYAGTILPAASFVFDHAPVTCKVAGTPVGPGIAELLAPLEPGVSRYYLVSASNCDGESPRGARSDGTPHPDLASDCGPLP